MINKLSEIKHLNDFENILITDENGSILFFDAADLSLLKELELDPKMVIGRKVYELYSNLSDETSSIMKVLKSGIPICTYKQELTSRSGNHVFVINSTYPIIEDGRIIGAIEFSKHYLTKASEVMLENYSKHKIFRKNNTQYTADDIVTVNPRMLAIKERLEKIAKTSSSVLIYGKTGTGKEVIAQAIHNLSDRYDKPFVSQNCGAIPSTLLESILFGTTKGSFTGSVDSKGIFEQAEGGTLFLDEVNSMDFNLQVKLLKAIEEKQIRRVGGSKAIPLDIRIISATNELPEKIVAEKILREDLFYRLAVVELNLPSLSERKEDIRGLVAYYMELYNKNMQIKLNHVHADVWDCFYRYSWPGNLRELRNALETAYNSASSSTITLDDIPERIRSNNTNYSYKSKSIIEKPLKAYLEDYERQLIVDELKNAGYSVSEAARRLMISKQLLKYKMNKYHLSQNE